MGYTFEPKEPHAKAQATNLRISRKNSNIVCSAVRKKKLTVAKRLLQGLVDGTRNLDGKHYTHAARDMLDLIESCEKNADNKGLDKGKLFVHVSASEGTHVMRARRKGAYGSRMKMTNLEVILIERGKIAQK